MADVDLQDEPLQVRVMDYDTYSANDLIGKVYFNLNPLLLGSNAEIRSALKPIQSAPGMLSGRNKAPFDKEVCYIYFIRNIMDDIVLESFSHAA